MTVSILQVLWIAVSTGLLLQPDHTPIHIVFKQESITDAAGDRFLHRSDLHYGISLLTIICLISPFRLVYTLRSLHCTLVLMLRLAV